VNGVQSDVDFTLLKDECSFILQPGKNEIEEKINLSPFENKSCVGLYGSNGSVFTQCEPEGFRKIFWHADRPDALSPFKVTLQGDPTEFPVMLAGGELIEKKEEGGRISLTYV